MKCSYEAQFLQSLVCINPVVALHLEKTLTSSKAELWTLLLVAHVPATQVLVAAPSMAGPTGANGYRQ